jgi:large subunit ribosomal protein L29
LQDELFGLKFQQILGQLEDTTVLKKTRKDIARIKTVLREKELRIG